MLVAEPFPDAASEGASEVAVTDEMEVVVVSALTAVEVLFLAARVAVVVQQ